ncbi:hypothetical protein SKAU_G00162760 [Synaphobranchus kaupii]|uniref:Uncharacterized protein n=1 Tax=Synaphobranchus kaupii TaxID=118154 RepID=A0A9Q1FJ02_SYNKA|nr:hypothetical protein SKAU_G00162760 [Synaphobranchus kaupii]
MLSLTEEGWGTGRRFCRITSPDSTRTCSSPTAPQWRYPPRLMGKATTFLSGGCSGNRAVQSHEIPALRAFHTVPLKGLGFRSGFSPLPTPRLRWLLYFSQVEPRVRALRLLAGLQVQRELI